MGDKLKPGTFSVSDGDEKPRKIKTVGQLKKFLESLPDDFPVTGDPLPHKGDRDYGLSVYRATLSRYVGSVKAEVLVLEPIEIY